MSKELKIDIMDDVVDIPDNRDWLFDEFLQEEQAEAMTERVRPTDIYKVLDQWKTSMCTLYAIQAIINAYTILEDIKEEWETIRPQIDPATRGLDDIRVLQTRVNNANKSWEIDGFLSIPRVWWNTPTGKMTIERRNRELQIALQRWFFIYTGTNNTGWTMTMSPLLRMQQKQFIWHAFSLTGANDVYRSDSWLYKFVNSYGKERGDKWYWYIRPHDVDKLFTCYIIIPKDSNEFFKKYRKNKKIYSLINQAKELYREGTPEIQKYFEQIQLSKNLEQLYKL